MENKKILYFPYECILIKLGVSLNVAVVYLYLHEYLIASHPRNRKPAANLQTCIVHSLSTQV